MAYDETTFRRPDEQGDDPAAYRTNGFTPGEYRGRRRDLDPDDTGDRYLETPEEPLRHLARDAGRDRLGVHIGWEIVLLVAVAAIGYLLYRLDSTSLRRPALDALLISGTVIGLLTLGAGLTLRAGVPNLAVGPIALAAALQYAEQGDKGLVQAAWPALAVAAAGGLVIALLIIGLHVPGWIATLAGAMGVIVYCQLRTAPVVVQGDYDPSNQAFFLFGAFALVAVVGGALGSTGPVRRMLGRLRSPGDPAERRGLAAALPVVGSLVLSSVFAVVAGILMAAQSTQPIAPATGLEWTGIAFGTALLAGTSAFGRRGGVFGTLLAVAGIALFLDYADRRNFDIALFAIGACAVAGGLMVTRLVETYGRPMSAGIDEDWHSAATTGTTANWSPEMPESWSAIASPQNHWDQGPWGSAR
jgi:ribose/xylose/arabinose/galactoside ABC-type transport system permease subunit